MIIKYLDQTDKMKDIGKIDVPITYHEGMTLTKMMIKDSWKVFIKDILFLKEYAQKLGVDECYKQTMKFSMNITDTNLIFLDRKIDTSWDSYKKNRDYLGDVSITPAYIQRPRTAYLKLPQLYRDLKKDNRYFFPTFLKSVYRKNKNIKIEQIAGFGKVLINATYFPDIKMDFFLNTREKQIIQKGNKILNINTIDSFFGHLEKTSSEELSNKKFIVMFDNYSDINSDYYVANILEDTNDRNFYDELLEKEELWKYIYHKIVNFELNSFNDYKLLLDEIVLGSQEFL